MNIKQDFKVYCSTNLNKSLLETAIAEDTYNDLIIEGIASTTSVDEDGDYMTKSCLEDMKRQALGLSILKEHGRTLDDIIGRVIEITENTADTFKIKFKVLPRFEYYLLELLENDINLGLSIGAKALDYEPKDDDSYGWKINKVKLYEISLVPLPANWDSFGSVKVVSKELTDDTIIAKCFNGACKQLVKEYSENINKEVEDAQKDDEEEFLTKRDAINLMNELGIGIYERVLSEVLEECKNMNEKYHLNNNTTNQTDEDETKSNSNDDKIDENSSNTKEDEEKKKNMSEENIKKVETETPDVQKELEENGTSQEEAVELEKEVKEPETVDVTVGVDEVSNADVLKSIGDMKSFMTKGFEGIEAKIDAKIDAKVEEKVESMRKNIREEVEDELFKELTTERKPVETEQPEVEKEVEVEEEEEVNKAMNAHDIAKMLCS